MKTVQDNGLNTELQELYLVNKQWLSDLDFLKTELSFLENRFGTSFAPLMKKDDAERMTSLLIKAVEIDATNLVMRGQINGFLKKIEQQMLVEIPDFTFDFVKEHGQHFNNMALVMQAYHLVKSKIFALAEQSLKTDPYLGYIRMDLRDMASPQHTSNPEIR